MRNQCQQCKARFEKFIEQSEKNLREIKFMNDLYDSMYRNNDSLVEKVWKAFKKSHNKYANRR